MRVSSARSPNIVTFSGPSGVGKTTLVRLLIQEVHSVSVKLVTSLTSRGSRNSDLPGEYRYLVTTEEFMALQKSGKLMWLVNPCEGHGNYYATPKESVKKALDDFFNLHVMILMPSTVEILIGEIGREAIIPFFIYARNLRILRERLLSRGSSEGHVDRRIRDCKTWVAEARRSKVKYIMVDNSGILDETFSKIIQKLLGHIASVTI